MKILALLGACLLLAELAYAQLPTVQPTATPKSKSTFPIMTPEEAKGGASPTPLPTPPPPGWQTANPPVSVPVPPTKR